MRPYATKLQAELKDHKVVRERSAGVSVTGTRVLYAPLPPDTLRTIQVKEKKILYLTHTFSPSLSPPARAHGGLAAATLYVCV